MSEERYSTAGNKTIIDSYGGEIKPMSIVDSAERLNNLERQLAEAREENDRLREYGVDAFKLGFDLGLNFKLGLEVSLIN